ncbi:MULTISPECIES: c-type cytochrome [Colwellia]|uniref:cytochrome-c oxidase n=1 Tax=Colwellia marinimaniae TaxID=1513592 RepID=A0ABQ0MU20_9GAMM|nr:MULTISPECIES: c-type cytochrome [Colwellia]GAW95860.1 Alternative cytochrome c oxidase subunit 2 [Colwellia marinimaniae]
MTIAIVIILLVIATLIFHFVSPWWFTPLASNWQAIDDTINISLWVVGTVFVAVNLFLAFVIIKYRHNKDRRADYEPENSKLEAWLTVVTTIGVAAMLAPGLVVWGEFITVPENSEIVEAVGQQWHWSYRLPGKDGKLGKTAIKLITEDNPFGLDVNDINGSDDLLVNSNELHLLIDQPVKVLLRSKDVLHNFAVPQFRVKMDLVPGAITNVWFTPTKLGRYELLCEELCGIAHFTMRGFIKVDSASDYQTWLASLPTFTQTLTRDSANIALGKQLYAGCAACHGINGQGNEAMGAPKVAGLSRWYLQRQLHYFKEKIRGQNSADLYGQQMAAMSVLLADNKAITDVSAYLSALIPTKKSPFEKTSSENTLVTGGDAIKGKSLYKNCAYCHGEHAQGHYAMNAPKLAGQHAWYLKRQINAYQQGIRGTHPADLYGNQMVLMSKILHDQQAVIDVVSYINSLPNVK